MCLLCDNVKKFVNANIVIYDDTTANIIKQYSYPDSTVTLKITSGGYKGDSHILTGMLELKGLKYCPHCGKKIEGFDDCASKENDKISCEIEKLKRRIIMTKKYREKPCNEVEAIQWTGKNISEVRNFTIKNCNGVAEQRSYLSLSSCSDSMPKLFIMEPDKDVEVSINDYIVKGTDGEFYVCERNVFEAVYEEVEEPKSVLKKIEAAIIGLQSIIDDNDGDKSVQSMIYEHLASKAIAE